jgi:hypothetical protein
MMTIQVLGAGNQFSLLGRWEKRTIPIFQEGTGVVVIMPGTGIDPKCRRQRNLKGDYRSHHDGDDDFDQGFHWPYPRLINH